MFEPKYPQSGLIWLSNAGKLARRRSKGRRQSTNERDINRSREEMCNEIFRQQLFSDFRQLDFASELKDDNLWEISSLQKRAFKSIHGTLLLGLENLNLNGNESVLFELIAKYIGFKILDIELDDCQNKVHTIKSMWKRQKWAIRLASLLTESITNFDKDRGQVFAEKLLELLSVFRHADIDKYPENNLAAAARCLFSLQERFTLINKEQVNELIENVIFPLFLRYAPDEDVYKKDPDTYLINYKDTIFTKVESREWKFPREDKSAYAAIYNLLEVLVRLSKSLTPFIKITEEKELVGALIVITQMLHPECYYEERELFVKEHMLNILSSGSDWLRLHAYQMVNWALGLSAQEKASMVAKCLEASLATSDIILRENAAKFIDYQAGGCPVFNLVNEHLVRKYGDLEYFRLMTVSIRAANGMANWPKFPQTLLNVLGESYRNQSRFAAILNESFDRRFTSYLANCKGETDFDWYSLSEALSYTRHGSIRLSDETERNFLKKLLIHHDESHGFRIYREGLTLPIKYEIHPEAWDLFDKWLARSKSLKSLHERWNIKMDLKVLLQHLIIHDSSPLYEWDRLSSILEYTKREIQETTEDTLIEEVLACWPRKFKTQQRWDRKYSFFQLVEKLSFPIQDCGEETRRVSGQVRYLYLAAGEIDRNLLLSMLGDRGALPEMREAISGLISDLKSSRDPCSHLGQITKTLISSKTLKTILEDSQADSEYLKREDVSEACEAFSKHLDSRAKLATDGSIEKTWYIGLKQELESLRAPKELSEQMRETDQNLVPVRRPPDLCSAHQVPSTGRIKTEM